MISVDYLETLAAPPADITLLEQLAAEHRDSGKYTEAQQHQDQADLLRKELEERRMQVGYISTTHWFVLSLF